MQHECNSVLTDEFYFRTLTFDSCQNNPVVGAHAQKSLKT